LVIHSRPYQPEGRGKVERCFRTVREQFLANLDPKRLLSLEELNERLWAWIDQVYHCSAHSAIGTTPLLRWQRDIEHIRQLPPATDLRRLFFHRHDRLVRRDSTFWLHKCLYEAPPHGGTPAGPVRGQTDATSYPLPWLVCSRKCCFSAACQTGFMAIG
jgi:putative transposase